MENKKKNDLKHRGSKIRFKKKRLEKPEKKAFYEPVMGRVTIKEMG